MQQAVYEAKTKPNTTVNYSYADTGSRPSAPVAIQTATVAEKCPDGQHRDASGACVPDSNPAVDQGGAVSAYLMWGGLILLLVAGGGYVAYKATR